MIDNELIMSFDINYINESKIIDGFWNIVDKLAEKIINLFAAGCSVSCKSGTYACCSLRCTCVNE